MVQPSFEVDVRRNEPLLLALNAGDCPRIQDPIRPFDPGRRNGLTFLDLRVQRSHIFDGAQKAEQPAREQFPCWLKRAFGADASSALRSAELPALRASSRDDHGLSPITQGQRAAVILWTDDTAAAFTELTTDGVEALAEPYEWLGRLLIAWIADPDGNPIQIVQDL